MNQQTHNPDAHSHPVKAIRLFLGGSFDPVHQGHVALLYHVAHQCRIIAPHDLPIYAAFLPTARSPLKEQSCAPKHRLNMLKLAIAFYQSSFQSKYQSSHQFHYHPKPTADANLNSTSNGANRLPIIPSICELELWQTPPTYTIDTLHTLREIYPDDSLIFIMGADNAASLLKWRSGLSLTTQAHLWICPRNDWQSTAQIDTALPSMLRPQVCDDISALKTTLSGRIYIDKTAMMAVSSSQIRQQLHQMLQKNPHQTFNKNSILNKGSVLSHLAPSVYDYICQHHLYES